MNFSKLFDPSYDPLKEPEYESKINSIVETCKNPQIWEASCTNGVILYIRFSKGTLTCLNKATGQYICSGNPVLHKDWVPTDRIPFYLEMYSKHKINFIL